MHNPSLQATFISHTLIICSTVYDLIIYVSITVPPVISPAGPTPVSVLVGQALILEVNITEFNLPLTVIWSFEGIVLADGMDRISITTPADLTTPPVTSTLVRMPILSVEDEGNYDVTAGNLADNALSRFQVTVNGEPL